MSDKSGLLVAKRTIGLLGLIGAILFGGQVADDAVSFQLIMKLQGSTGWCCSWYSTSWLKNPYTLWKLQGAPYEDRVVKDEAGGTRIIRDVQYGKVGFWTELGGE